MGAAYTPFQKQLLKAMQSGICPRCRQPLPDNFEGHAIFSECMIKDAPGQSFDEAFSNNYNKRSKAWRGGRVDDGDGLEICKFVCEIVILRSY